MKRILLPVLLVLCASSSFSQKKSELLVQIDNLKQRIQHLEQEASEAKRAVASSKVKAETLEAENEDLRNANNTLLSNLGSFSALSKKNSENVNKTLSALERKEKQLNEINTIMTSNDSIVITSPERIAQYLGKNAKAEITEGAIVLPNDLNTLFGSDTAVQLTQAGKTWLAKVAQVILAHPTFNVTVEGLNITGEFGATFSQVAEVAKELADTLKVPVASLSTTVKDGNFKEGVHIKLQPDYTAFYNKVKEHIKSNS